MAQLLPNGQQQFFYDNGSPLANGKVYFYAQGTTTPKTTYADSAGSVPNTNPVILDSAGRAVIYGGGTYRQVVKDVNGVQIWDSETTDPSSSETTASLVKFADGNTVQDLASTDPSKGAALVSLGDISLADAILLPRGTVANAIGYITPEMFGAKGDGVTDDTAALQAALNFLAPTNAASSTGGGTLILNPKKYRVTDTLLIGYGTTIKGFGAGGYPYIGANAQVSEIYADFGADTNKFAIDSATYKAAGGARYAYNEWANSNVDTDYNSLHNIALKGFYLTSSDAATQNNIVYGSIRLIGCPNAIIDEVTVAGFGMAPVLNTSFGTRITRFTSQTQYFGIVCYNANNTITIEAQCDQIVSPAKLTVPVANIPSWMPTVASLTGGSFNMSASHYQSSKGLIIAAAQSIGSNGAVVNFTGEYWDDIAFLFNSYATTFTKLYAEGPATENVIASAYASFVCLNMQNYTNASACVIDAGYNSIGEINVGGNNVSTVFARNVWGSGSTSDLTNILVKNNSQGQNIALSHRLNFDHHEIDFTPNLVSSAGTITTVGATYGTCILNGAMCTLILDLTITTNGSGAAALVVNNLPVTPKKVSVGGGKISTTNEDVNVRASAGSNSIVMLKYNGSYPGGDGYQINCSVSFPL